jgi:hypothetical protein
MIYLCVLLAFAVRLHYLTLMEFHVDEFFSMLAAQMTVQKGVPILPSGLLYDHGLLFSYLDALFIGLFGFSEAMARWPSVIIGTLGVVSVFAVARHLFRSPWVGLVASLALALDESSVIWGGRARMLAMAQLAAIWTIFLFWWSLRPGRQFRQRLAFVGACLGLLLSHMASVILLPGLAAGALALAVGDPDPRVRSQFRWYLLWREALILLLALGLAVGVSLIGQLPTLLGHQDFGQATQIQVIQPGGGFLKIPSDVRAAVDKLFVYFTEFPNLLFVLFVGMGGGCVTWRVLRKGWQQTDMRWLYLLVVLGGMLFTFAVFIDPLWQRTRYLTAIALPAYYLLGAGGLACAASILTARYRVPFLVGSGGLVAASFAMALVPLLAKGSDGHLRYDLAFSFAREHWQAGDRVMTEHAAASYLYLGRNDLYIDPDSAKVLSRDGQLVDRYAGAPLIETANDLQPELERPGRIWLVIGEDWFFRQLSPYFLQQILWQMDKVFYSYGVWGLVSREDAWPLARVPATSTDLRFADETILKGYTDQVIGNTLRLTLFWQPGDVARHWKVFVHARNDANETVAQADHWLYRGAVPGDRWEYLLAGGEPARDGAQLSFPEDLPAGEYRVLVGFYNHETGERLPPILDDTHEAAVTLLTFNLGR